MNDICLLEPFCIFVASGFLFTGYEPTRKILKRVFLSATIVFDDDFTVHTRKS